MTEQELIFEKIKSLKLIASMEALKSNAGFIIDVLRKEPHSDKSSLSMIFDKLDYNQVIINQLLQLKLLLKDAEIEVLLEKISEKNAITSNPDLSELTKVNSVMHDIRMAISSAKEDISENKTQGLKVSSNSKSESTLHEIALSQEIKHYIKRTLDKFLKENIDNIMDEVIKIKKEKKSKVLDLSEVSVTPKITPKK